MSDPLSRRTARGSVRTPFQGEIRLKYGRDREVVTRTIDLGGGGVFVLARPPQPVGTLVRFELPVLDGSRTVTGYGEVVWIRVRDDPKAGPAGMGIQFRYMDAPGETWLREHEAQVQAQAVLAPRPPAPSPPSSKAERPLPLVLPGAPPRPVPAADPALWPPDRLAMPEVPAAANPAAASAADWEGEDPFPEPPELAPAELEPFASEEGRASRRYARPLVLAAVGLLLVAAALLGRGLLSRWPADEPAAVAAPVAPRPSAPEAPAPVAATLAPPPIPATANPPPSSPRAPIAGAPAAANGPLTRVASITYGSVPGETIVVLAGDGQILEERVSRQRLDGAEPRELLRIAGIVAPYEPAVIPVGTGEVVRIRTGHHPGPGGGELYVVFDLPNPKAGVHHLDYQPTGLRIYLRRRVN